MSEQVRLWKCYNCTGPTGEPGVDFFAAKPVCPTCKIDGTQPRFASKIAQCRIIHFDPPHAEIEGVHANVIACQPEVAIGGKVNVMATGVADVVNCPNCRKTEVWKKAKAAADSGPDGLEGVPAGLASEVLKHG